MFRSMVFVLSIGFLLAATVATAGTPMPIPPSSPEVALTPPVVKLPPGMDKLGPQPEPPDLPAPTWEQFLMELLLYGF